MLKEFVFLSGAALAAPIFPLYFVREIHATDAWIGIISTAGYPQFWSLVISSGLVNLDGMALVRLSCGQH